MKLTITYPEIQDLIKQKAQKSIRLSALDSRTICISTDITLPWVGKKEVKVQLTINDINNDYALLTYNNGLGVDLVITAFLKYIEMQTNISYVQGLSDNRIKIHLNQITKLKNVLSKIVIQNLSFTNENMVLYFVMK